MMDKKIFKDVPDVVHDTILNTLSSLEENNSADNCRITGSKKYSQKRKKSVSRFRYAAAACAALVLVTGITVSATGLVKSYREQMEEMDEESIDEYYSIAMAGDTIEYSRLLTDEENARREELTDLYEFDGVVPESLLTYVESADEYTGKGVALNITNSTLYLPEETLSDEELLEIIDLEHRVNYSIYSKNNEATASDDSSYDWQSHLAEVMTDDEITEIYLVMFTSQVSDISGNYCRELTDDERSRYEALVTQYENEGADITLEMTVIDDPSEYTGEGIAICSYDSTYYFPDDTLTDDELLLIIDYDHRSTYAINRIGEDINMGFREDYPHK